MVASKSLYFFFKTRFWGLFLSFILFTISCRNDKTEATAGYSDAFKPIFERATFLFTTNRVDQGMHYLDSSFSHIASPSIDDKFRVLGFHYVYWHKAKVDNRNAILVADSMLAVAKKSVTNKQYIANFVEANLALGDAYFELQQYDNAYQHYFQGYRVGEKNLDKRALSDYAYRMGMITYKMHDYQLAAKYFKESAHLSTLVDDEFAYFYRLQEVYDNIALSFKHNNQPDSAIVYFNKAISFINQNTPRFKDRTKMIDMALGVVYGNKAEVLTLKGDYAEATGLLKKSIAINLQPGYDNNDAALAEIKLAQIYFDRHQSDALVKLLRDMRLQFDTIKNQAAEADWNRLMSDYSLEKNDPAKALNYLRTYNILKDSVMAKVNLLRESNVNEQLENFEKQYQIDSLKDNNNLQKRYLYVAIVCAILSLIIIFLVLRNWIRSKNDIRIVNALNKQVNSQKASLEKTLADLKASDLEKDRILRTVAHDLRNPIGGIAALTRTMADDNYTEEQLEFINLIKETSQNSLALINEILEVTNNGSVKLIKEPSDINALLSNSVELLNFKAAEKDQHIILTPTEAPLIINISREKIWRVISNLISNALKFSPQKAIVNVKVIDLGKMIQITVTDTGMGIPDDLKTKVFNMFTEAKRPGTDGEKSFGLGLSISKQIIEDHRGKLWFESDGKTGTTFFVNLPKK